MDQKFSSQNQEDPSEQEQNQLDTDQKKLNKSLFWKYEPIYHFGDPLPQKSGPIGKIKTIEEIQKESYELPYGLKWVNVNLNNNEEIDQLYNLLKNSYVEDDDNMFRFDYSKEFIKWALSPPGQHEDWLVGIREISTLKLVGFFSAIPVDVVLQKKDKIKMAELNFLCLHQSLRRMKLTPILYKEIARRVNMKNIWQEVFTAGVCFTKPTSEAQYFHRPLNPKKLIEVGFLSLSPNFTISRTKKKYELPQNTNIDGLRPFVKEDTSAVASLLNNYLEQFDLYTHFTEQDTLHYFLPIDNVIYSYVVEDKDKKITDFFSFYGIPLTVLNHPFHSQLKIAYSYYHVSAATPLESLLYNALILANNNNFDVFNALDLMENKKFINKLLFTPGDGILHYYLYNWGLSQRLLPEQIGMVLV